jgi:hypothetical protein
MTTMEDLALATNVPLCRKRLFRLVHTIVTVVGLSLLQTNTLIVHLPALNSVVHFPMTREPGLDRWSNDIGPTHLVALEFIGAGQFGRIFKAKLHQRHRRSLDGFVVKLAKHGCEPSLEEEAQAYHRLGSICGVSVSQFYGLFHGVFQGTNFSVILMSYEGRSLETYGDLSLASR